MAYENDPDAALRGVGAIASRDAGNRKRQMLRVQQARATQARDRTMSKIGYAQRGGMARGALGAVNQTVTGSVWAGDQEGGPPPPPTKLYEGGGSTPIYTATTARLTGPAMMPPVSMSPPFVGPTMMPPVPAPINVAMSPPLIGPPGATVTPIVAMPVVSNKKWLIIGAVGIAAYLMFRKGGPP